MNNPSRRRRFSAWDGRKFQVQGASPIGQAPDDELTHADKPLSLPLNADELDYPPNAAARLAAPTLEASDPGAESPDTLALGFQPLTGRRLRPGAKRRFSSGAVALLSGLCLAGGVAGGYFAHRPAVKPAPRDETPTLRAEDYRQLDAAFSARYAGKLAEATSLFGALGQKYPRWSALQLEIARTQLYQANLIGAGATLRAVLNSGSSAAEANFLLGTICHVQKDFSNAEAYLAAAAALDPTQASYDYFWGETLRADGKLRDAADKFRAALSRNQYETGNGLYRVKVWLCEIEANLEKSSGADAEIDAALATPLPPMEALFAAAARDLKAGNLPAAAQHLRDARLRTDPAVFPVLMHDPFFDQYHSVPELAELFRPIASPDAVHSPTHAGTPPAPQVP